MKTLPGTEATLRGLKEVLPFDPLHNPLYRLLMGEAEESTLPEVPCLEEVAGELLKTGGAAELFDENWKLRWVSEELKLILGEDDDKKLGMGRAVLECYQMNIRKKILSKASRHQELKRSLPYIASDMGMRSLKSQQLNQELKGLMKGLKAEGPPPVWASELEFLQGDLPPVRIWCISMRIFNKDGEFQGTLRAYSPGLKASVLALVARGDERMFERMVKLFEPGPRKAAILFADLEASTKLSRKLPTGNYFSLLSNLTRTIDDIVIANGGIVGKHVGDGVSAFFLAEDMESVSASSKAAIKSAREIQAATVKLNQKACQKLGEDLGLKVNLGLHWGGTLYMGQIVTGGRLEVTALGDEVNECARMEQAARGGEILASKGLVERLSPEDAKELKLNLMKLRYHTLSEHDGVPAKALRDVSNIPVTSLSNQTQKPVKKNS